MTTISSLTPYKIAVSLDRYGVGFLDAAQRRCGVRLSKHFIKLSSGHTSERIIFVRTIVNDLMKEREHIVHNRIVTRVGWNKTGKTIADSVDVSISVRK